MEFWGGGECYVFWCLKHHVKWPVPLTFRAIHSYERCLPSCTSEWLWWWGALHMGFQAPEKMKPHPTPRNATGSLGFHTGASPRILGATRGKGGNSSRCNCVKHFGQLETPDNIKVLRVEARPSPDISSVTTNGKLNWRGPGEVSSIQTQKEWLCNLCIVHMVKTE